MKSESIIRQNGFSILETLVSLAVIGIVGASVITNFIGNAPPVNGSNSEINIDFEREDHFILNQQPPSLQGNSSTENYRLDEQTIMIKAEVVARRMELRIVQTAMDTMMIEKGIKAVTMTLDTQDMSAFPSGNPLYPEYLRSATTQYKYKCDSRGEVIQVKD